MHGPSLNSVSERRDFAGLKGSADMQVALVEVAGEVLASVVLLEDGVEVG
jgi:hypothetical protein